MKGELSGGRRMRVGKNEREVCVSNRFGIMIGLRTREDIDLSSINKYK